MAHTSIFSLCFMSVCLMKSNCYSSFFFGTNTNSTYSTKPNICVLNEKNKLNVTTFSLLFNSMQSTCLYQENPILTLVSYSGRRLDSCEALSRFELCVVVVTICRYASELCVMLDLGFNTTQPLRITVLTLISDMKFLTLLNTLSQFPILLNILESNLSILP